MEATEHRVGHGHDRPFPGLLKGRPRQARSELRDPLNSLMRPALIVVCDVGSDGSAKVVLGEEEEVIQALPPQASHEPLDVRRRIRSAVGDGHALDVMTSPNHRSRALR